ncbi:hypothetical protein ES703_26099 [subsurface metagenome]
MGRSGKMVVIFLFILNFLAVCMGYVGIDKLERYHYPPFNQGLFNVVCGAKYVPDGIVMFWQSRFGACVVWAGSIVFPIAAAYLLFGKEKLWTGITLLLLSFLPFGFTGFLIWIHAFCDLPHEW